MGSWFYSYTNISGYNKVICFLLFLVDVFGKHAWLVLLKDKKGKTITKAFQKIV